MTEQTIFDQVPVDVVKAKLVELPEGSQGILFVAKGPDTKKEVFQKLSSIRFPKPVKILICVVDDIDEVRFVETTEDVKNFIQGNRNEG